MKSSNVQLAFVFVAESVAYDASEYLSIQAGFPIVRLLFQSAQQRGVERVLTVQLRLNSITELSSILFQLAIRAGESRDK